MLKAEPAGAFHQPRLAGSFSGSPGSWTWIRDSRLTQTSRRRSTYHPKNPVPCHDMLCGVVFCAAVRCHALRCNALSCNDSLRSAMLFYAMPCSALLCIAYPLGIIALLDIRVYE